MFTIVPLTAQRGGGGKGGGGNGGGDPATIYRPVIVGYPGIFGGGSAARYDDPDPAWLTEIDGSYAYYHPDQMEVSGAKRALVQAVSIKGDLTHRGGDRFVLDVREAPDGSRALITTAETVGTPENPTWYYDGPGGTDDAVDHVLLTDTTYAVTRARWSRSGIRVAFEGTSVATNQSGVFVGDVVLNGSGEPAGLANIILVAPTGLSPSWGGDNRIAFLRHNAGQLAGFVVDVTAPTAPTEFPLGTVGGTSGTGPPALSSTGQLVVYSKSVGSRSDLFVLDLMTAIEIRITDANRVPETMPGFPTWSPDDMQILFSVNDRCGEKCRSLAIIDVVGTAKRNTITKTFVVQVGKGRNGRNVIVGAVGSAIWRN